MTKQAQVDIILIGDDNQVTRNCIKSIESNTYCHYNIIVEPFQGYNYSLNEGARKGNSDYIAFCNNDLIFQDGWFEPLQKTLELVDSVSPWCELTHKQWWKNRTPSGSVYCTYEVGKCIAGWFIMMKRITWEQLGGFDERFEFWYADNAYAEQLKRAKMVHGLVYKSKVSHLQSTTLKQQSRDEQMRLTHEQLKTFKKHYN